MKITFLLTIIILTQLTCLGQERIDTLKQELSIIDNRIKLLEKEQSVVFDSIRVLRTEMITLKANAKGTLENISKNWVPIVALSISIITFIIVIFTFLHNKKIQRYKFVLDVAKDYASEEMLAAILRIREWEKGHKNFAVEFGNTRKSDYEKVKEIDKARRRISHFFNYFFLLYKNKAIAKKDIHKVLTVEQIDILKELIEPLEMAINPTYNNEIFTFFNEIRTDLQNKNEKRKS